jgi:hypothetical protein
MDTSGLSLFIFFFKPERASINVALTAHVATQPSQKRKPVHDDSLESPALSYKRRIDEHGEKLKRLLSNVVVEGKLSLKLETAMALPY